MTDHTASEVAAIVKGLTKAQRRVLETDIVGAANTMQALAYKGLYYFGSKTIKVHGTRCSYVIMPDGFTPLGLAVRKHLEVGL